MSPAEFKAARFELGLSSAALGRILGVDARTVRRWEDASDTRPPNATAAKAVSWFLGGFRPPDWPEAQATKAPKTGPAA